ncbi:hypothetical protein CKO31_24865 [Thiohalocapsa halophila]|uniref:Uncharacterized protein n=1 Tax=Thiohalocapsa halophila TaxID=69359 RepID=A0ABS1CPY1_9GAMM|nr:hypothetical protein [Thiohalocapsa halophila]MBK1633905.1 hypothetical protein [Thiohalocapsa halophila]
MSNIRAYSQRLLPPFSGVVQIAQSDRARAQSFDGLSWEVHYVPRRGQSQGQPQMPLGYALDRGYYRVAHFQDGRLTPYVLPAVLDAAQVGACIEELADFLRAVTVPFPVADVFEFWLLDGKDESPLALIFSCCEAAQMSTYPTKSGWTALPHSKLRIDSTAEEQARQEPPVNHRFQDMVTSRAGAQPRTAWIQRAAGDAGDFPPLLVREDWPSERERDICQRYLLRTAPILLMLQGLPRDDRERLEVAAKRHAVEVDRHYPLYPEINDEKRMAAIRVEARLRRGSPQTSGPSREKAATPAPLSKDMRILE